MVRELERVRQSSQFPETAPAANPVFFRTYSRRTEAGRETWDRVCDRTVQGLTQLGKLTPDEVALIDRMQRHLKTLTSGRWLWVGGSEWIETDENFSGAYNCSSTKITDWRAFGLLMDLAMMGCGTGAVLEPQYINQLPAIRNRLSVTLQGNIGTTPASERREQTEVKIEGDDVTIYVGDSRQGWVKSYQTLLELSSDERFSREVQVFVDLSDVRAAGETLKGFGGVANPVKLPGLYERCASILNKAVGRQLNSVECCLLIDEAAVTIVAGNIRRCIAYGTMVSEIYGMKPIQDIQVGDLVLTSSGEYRPVVNKFIQGVQDVVEIRTPATSIRCTANHRVAVYDSLRSYIWKYAGQLQKGDRLISVPHNKGADCTSTDYAWLLGLYIGDGYADVESPKPRNGKGEQVTFAFSKSRLEGKVGEKCLRILRQLGYTPTVSCNNNIGYIHVYHKALAVEFAQYKQPWSVPVIPEIIWKGTPEIRAAFLAGLSDADGTPSRNLLLNSNKLDFLREVQKLALSLGIATTLDERKPKILKDRETAYEGCHCIHIRGWQSQAVAVALINQFAVRDRFTLKLGKKNGLDLPYQFVQELVATGRGTTTVDTNQPIIVEISGKTGKFKDVTFDTLLAEDLVNPHWLPMEVQFVAPAGQAETFDIEVEGDHEFIADGLLVHNSAGMRQFYADDELGANAKNNLWQQDENGNWRIDPERDALRMSNHTRVFHHKPSLSECTDAVRKQYYSGEGAIMWAGEAVARANNDLLTTPSLKADFLKAYDQGKAQEWLQAHYPNLTTDELNHRLARFGLNPCGSLDFAA
ncbi:MAG TPA: LAGLIDADG family homing endonuclease [Candidatus Obscuribacterales bacterium]